MNARQGKFAHLRIGPIEARVERKDVLAYAAATTADGSVPPDDGLVPATFPAIWLWHPDAIEAVAEAARGLSAAPVLTAQRFEHHGRLRIGQAYRFVVERFPDRRDPDSFVIEARVHALDGAVLATVSASYRMFAFAPAEELA